MTAALPPPTKHREADEETRAHNQRKEREWLEAPERLEALLRELAPAVFCDPPRPLAIGIHETLIELLAGEFDAVTIRRFLLIWTRQSAYREALVAAAAVGGPRYDLDGVPCGVVVVP